MSKDIKNRILRGYLYNILYSNIIFSYLRVE